MARKLNLFFVCTANQQRSKTAEDIYKRDRRFNVRSAGTSSLAARRLRADDVEWADLIMVMEEGHKTEILTRFPEEAEGKKILVLGIPDVYQRDDPKLVSLIKEEVEKRLG